MARWQEMAARGPVPAAARAYSRFGEHASGWMALGSAGALIDAPRRRLWRRVALAAFVAHAAAVVLKRIMRRRRPSAPEIRVLTPTPSDLSFPSAHAASTAAALVVLAPVVGRPVAAGAAGCMALARVLLGVHYPTDVAAGLAVGLVVGRLCTARSAEPGQR